MTKSRHEHARGLRVRLLPRRRPARQGRPRAGLDDRLRARPVRLHARRPDREGPDALLRARSSRSTRRRRSSSGRRGPSCPRRPTSRIPFHQTLGYGGLDQTLSETNHLTAKVEYERYRENNFRVGGVADISYGQELNRDNLNVTPRGHVRTSATAPSTRCAAQFGRRKYDEPPNTTATAEWYSSGQHAPDGREHPRRPARRREPVGAPRHALPPLRRAAGTHDVKVGAGVQRVVDRSRIDTYAHGPLPLSDGHEGAPARLRLRRRLGGRQGEHDPARGASSRTTGARMSNLSVNLGVRYDLDTNGNNPDFHQPRSASTAARSTRQHPAAPRLLVGRHGQGRVRRARRRRHLHRAATSSSRSSPSCSRTAITGRITYTNLNGALLGFPAFALDPNNPQNTGIPLKPDDRAPRTDAEGARSPRRRRSASRRSSARRASTPTSRAST